MKNKQFKNFLKTRKQETVCNHSNDIWCQDCVNFGNEVEVEIRPGVISKGRFFTNQHPTTPTK